MRGLSRSLLVAVVAISSLGALVVPVFGAGPTPSPWYQDGFNQSRTAYNALEATLTSSNVSGLHPVWTKAVSSGGGVSLTESVSNAGVAYFQGGTTNRVYAVNATTGATVWTATAPGCPNFVVPPAIHLGVLVVSSQPCTSGAGYVSGYDVSTGHLMWTFRPGLNLTAPITENGAVYVESSDLHDSNIQVAKLDVHTGVVSWSVTRPAGSGLNAFQLAADSSHIYLTSPTYLQALNPSTGSSVWIKKVVGGLNLLVSAGHVVVSGVVSPGTGQITSYSAAGTRQWQVRVSELNTYAASPSQILLTTNDGLVQSRSLASGALTWQVSLPDFDYTAGQPAIAGSVLYVPFTTESSGPAVRAVNLASGANLWSHEFSSGDITQVSVAAGSLFASINGAGVTALRP